MRVLYDISCLGLGHIAASERGGSYRADVHLTERLSASRDCDLTFCANYSSTAYAGAVGYVREHPGIRHVPLLGAGDDWMGRRARPVIGTVRRGLRTMLRGRPVPRLLRAGSALLDARIHRATVDASPPVDIYHSSTIPLPSPRPPRRGPKRFVTIYDLRGSRGDASAAEVEHQAVILGSLREDDWVLTSSAATREELCDLGRIPAHQVVVAALAADAAVFRPCEDPAGLARLRTRYRIPPGPYVLMLNSLQPRKNTLAAVRAFCRLVQQEHVADLSLVLCGHPAARSRPVRDTIAGVPVLGRRVISTGYVPDADLATLYSHALVFVYPSVYEGFGLPPLEAMHCGTPVITSNTSSLPEVVGDAGVMVDSTDSDALGAAMLALYRDASWRDTVRRRCLARAELFSWDRTAACALAGFRAALAS